MKKLIGLLIISVVTFRTFAQDSTYAKIKDPDFPFEPMYVDSNLSTTVGFPIHSTSSKLVI